ncbi:hypothetical protein SARC_07271 [Sphaeroforma arctica JP610]|uniref:Uncharacterized protein n=1 Tax=Sphaeroforma arctica JP610 TaxID=667725 RepID=A0A0L0FUY1_9EUKA|nr:hypothetical protein SARC_07271 [Sphaeroforma arctica JP610]KNC80371.1 hypothetical protein SARC_07271 [Sphaeroforma arctica JP610]|eukprot:XP_014154273.1 hypothetical protein SARC_07271 [Sphaeroforma arctica JP610]
MILPTRQQNALDMEGQQGRLQQERRVATCAGGANERQDHSMDSDDSAKHSHPQQHSSVDSTSEVFTDDDECPDIMSDSDISSDDIIAWPTMGHRPPKPASFVRSARAAKPEPGSYSSEQPCWSLLSDSSDDSDSDHRTVTLSRPRAYNKRTCPVRRLKTAARSEQALQATPTITT